MIHHIKHATRHVVFWSLIVLAVSLTAVRLLLLGIDNYKADLSARVSQMVGAPVRIGHLRANMRGYKPELVLKDIEILSAVPQSQRVPKLQLGNESPAIQLKEIRMGINLLDMLFDRDRLASAWVTLVGAKLTVTRKADGSIAIVGLKATDDQPLWLLQGGKYEVLQSEINWLDERSKTKLAVVGKMDFAIMNNEQRHQINILLKFPKKYGDELRVSMDLQGNFFKPSSIDGTVFVEGKNIKPAAWVAGELPLAVNIGSGAGDFKLWSELQRSQPVSLVGDVQLQTLQLTRADHGAFPIKQLNTRFYWEQQDSQWRLDVPHFLLETVDKKWPDAVFSVSGNRYNDNLLSKAGLFVESMDLQEASSVVKFFAQLPKEAGELLTQAQLKGTLEQFSLFADLDNKHFAVNGKFTHITVAPTAAIPGMENLSGQLKGSDQEGSVALATQGAHVTGFFREAVKITKLQGMIGWRQTPDDWIVSSPNIALDTPDLKTNSRLSLRIPKTEDQKTFMDLQTAFAMNDLSKVSRYLPASTMNKSSVDWLDQAFISGRVSKGNLLFYGNLSDYPFTGGQGAFEAQFHVDQLELAYNPEWPHVTGLGGDFLFLQGGLQIDFDSGSSNKVRINQARLIIPELGKSEHVLVQGQLETDIRQGLEFMQKTPLKPPVDKFLDAVEPYGNTQVTLDLKLPLADGARAIVNGSAQLDNARLRIKALDLGVSQIKGAVKFKEQGVYSDTINASALDNPIQITIKSASLQTTVDVAGRAGINNLKKQFPLPGWQVADGAADYHLKLQLPYDDKSPDLLIQSKLTGVALDLPGGLAKTKDQQRALSLTFGLADEMFLPISLTYDNQLHAAINFDIKQRRVESGNILVGAGTVAQPQYPGIKLEINREKLALQDWLDLASSLAEAKGSETTSAVASLKEIKIHSKHGLWKKADMGFIDVVLKPDGRFWSGDIDSSIAKGNLKVPVDLNGPDSINMTMAVFDLSALKQFKAENEALKPAPVPEIMPLITMTSQKTLWQSVDLGQLNVETERIPKGIAFKRIDLVGRDQKLLLSGDWIVNGRKSETRVKGHLNLLREGRFLSKLAINEDIVDTKAVVDFNGSWDAAPYQFSLADLQGDVYAHFSRGRILGIEPGFGRVLGILALAQWIKRFQLDFSDVFDEGLTFSSITGHFDLLNGKATTRDLVVDAIPAKITLTGNTDLINQTVDYSVHVVPKSADAVPIAGTIMGKVADLIGRALTGKDQKGFFFGSHYLVKGKWQDAKIMPLHENNGLLEKTWDGITGFPWLQESKEH